MRLADALAAGPVVLDGGLATRLEASGHDLGGALWSARLLLDDPDAVAAAHRDFLDAGAQVSTTASYQLSATSLARAGVPAERAPDLLRRSVDVAHRARVEHAPGTWVAASVGPYGASLADGSEYTGAYGLGGHDATVAALRRFHRPRLDVLAQRVADGAADGGADVLACETVPSLTEVEALALELAGARVPTWVSVTVATGPDGAVRTRAGDDLADVGAALRDVPGLVAAGVNCCEPTDVEPALAALGAAVDVPLVAYPNSGETWDAVARTWRGDARWDDDLPRRWVSAGARLVGGCCRVGPDDVRRVAAQLAGP
ncbi:homocysteine S-methyltransferase [Thalassiella azotivora]